MKKIKIILVALVGVLIVSCDSTTVQEIQPVVTNPTYNSNIKAIMSAKCVSCHSSNGQNPALTNYAEVKDAIENGSLECRIQNDCGAIMPPSGKMPQVFIDMINNWKVQGYVE
ncbi:MAG: cytochrome c [Flavobacterium sp.]|uniref:c-type cytochrome n=1 Tax=Flavobacterium sp. TaxID=239 RepID=UPI003263E568